MLLASTLLVPLGFVRFTSGAMGERVTWAGLIALGLGGLAIAPLAA